MGLIRTTIKLIPYAAIGILGYYIGTIKSDQYETIFQNECIPSYSIESNRIQESELERELDNENNQR